MTMDAVATDNRNQIVIGTAACAIQRRRARALLGRPQQQCDRRMQQDNRLAHILRA